MDTFTQLKRSAVMRAIKGKNTVPELMVRSLLHSLGYRYRIHATTLPGKPDLVFASRGKVIFVHGCFWHGHEGCRYSHLPKSNQAYWEAKISRNKVRDARAIRRLRQLGWSVATVWACQVKDASRLEKRLVRFLET